MAHARLSPSSAKRWMTCPGSVKLTDGLVDEGSEHAAEGTAAHEMAERILKGEAGFELVGRKAENGVEFTEDMLRYVQVYVTLITDLRGEGGELLVEQRLPIGQWTGEDGAHGTSDAVIINGEELTVADLKFGRGVAVEADHNEQLMIYALAALDQYDLIHGPFSTVRLVISQPRLGAVSEWPVSVTDLLAFGERVKAAAAACDQPDAPLVPSEGACRWCKAKATCPKLQGEVLEMFEAVDPKDASLPADNLALAMSKVGLIEGWCKAVRAETERRLLAGEAVAGWKLVQGKKGNRKWSDAEEAEALLKGFKLKLEDIYDLSLISPTTAEKRAAAGTIGPRRWKKLLPLITQSEGSPSVAPASDKRPALPVSAVTDEFEVLTPELSADDLL